MDLPARFTHSLAMFDRTAKSRRGARAETGSSPLLFRQMVEALPHMAWSARPDGQIDYLNARVLEYTGSTHKELQGWGWRAMVHPEDWERCHARWTKAFTKGQPYEVEYRLRRRDGRYFWHLCAAMPVREGGNIVRWVGTCTDIENQKRAENLLEKARESIESMVAMRAVAEAESQAQQERFRKFMDSVPAIAWIKDAALRYIWISASYGRLHGVLMDDMRGKTDFELWSDELARLFRKDDELALRANGPVQFIERSPFVDGSTAHWLVVKFPMPDATGGMGVAGIGFDITDEYLAPEGAADSASPDPISRLSARERQVMQMVVEGYTSAQAGARLGLSPKSIDTYRSRLMAKLGIDDLPSLVKFALRHGLTTRR